MARRVIRSRGLATVNGIIGALVGVFLVASFLLDKNQDTVDRVIGCVVGVLVGAWMVGRLARAGVFILPSGIRVMNPFRSYTYAWKDIVSFEVGSWRIYPRIGIVNLQNGTRRAIFGIEGPSPVFRPNNRSAEALIDELSSLLNEARAAESHTSVPPRPDGPRPRLG